LLAKTAAPA